MNKRTAVVVGTVVATVLAGSLPAVAGRSRAKSKQKSTTIVAPANDSFAAGTQITEMPFGSVIDFTSASIEAGEPQPTCSEAKATVWYSVTSASEQDLVAKAAAEFPNAIAIYSGAGLSELSEVTCAAEGHSTEVAFPASSGAVYFVQVAAPRKHRGTLGFSLEADPWQTETLREAEFLINTPEIDRAAIVIDGKARENNRNVYDLTVTTNETTIGPYGVTTPVELPSIHQELAKVRGQEIVLQLTSSYRYDKTQKDCRLYDGEDCIVGLPITGDAGWYTENGSEAELIVTLRIVVNGKVRAERTVAAPFAGQIGGTLP